MRRDRFGTNSAGLDENNTFCNYLGDMDRQKSASHWNCQGDSGFPCGRLVDALNLAEPAISRRPSANLQNSIHPRQKYPYSCTRRLSRVLAGLLSSSNQKNHLHSFFGGCRIRDGSGTRGYRSFFCLRKGAGTSMGRGLRDFFAGIEGCGSLPEIKYGSLSSRSPFLTTWLKRSFCTSFRLLKEEAVCLCSGRQR